MPRLDSRNLRKHSDRNKALIRKSLEEVGAGRSILLDADDTVIAGNGVLVEAEAMGIPVQVVESDGKSLIAVKRKDLSGAKARRAAFLDNATGDSSAYDYDVELLRQLATEDDVVKRIAEQDEKLAALIREPKEEKVDPGELLDKAEELQKKWQVKRGDVWECGKHRVMCGDSTSAEDVARLMRGEKAQAVVTDSPYGVTKEEWDRYVTQDDLNLFLSNSIGAIVAFGAAPPKALLPFLLLKPIPERVYIWWNTFTRTNSEGAFWQWQPIWVWRRSEFTGLGRDIIDMIANTGGGVQLHPTQKPVPLMAELIRAATKENQFVLDPFLGSGTTMVAAHNTGRVGRGMEICEKYVSVSLQRLTGLGLECKRIPE